jgi:hypothetical protein
VESELHRELERYQQAATVSLELLEWVVGYLRRINKPQIAAAIDQNRERIESSLR